MLAVYLFIVLRAVMSLAINKATAACSYAALRPLRQRVWCVCCRKQMDGHCIVEILQFSHPWSGSRWLWCSLFNFL